jgi:hypothetical protein
MSHVCAHIGEIFNIYNPVKSYLTEKIEKKLKELENKENRREILNE